MGIAEGELVVDSTNNRQGGRWVKMLREQFSMGASWRAEPLASRPPATEAPQPPVPKFSGPPTRIIGLASMASVDGWDLQVGEPRTFPRQLADELIRARHARLAKPGEILTDE